MTGPVSELTAWLQPRLGEVVVALAALLFLLLLLVARLSALLRDARRHYLALADGVDQGNLEQFLNRHLARIDAATTEVGALRGELSRLKQQTDGCVQRLGLVRYDAFGDVGGQVSFALALLDHVGDGVLLNSLFSRESSSTYLKPIKAGVASVPLSDEEAEALRQALAKGRSRTS